MRATKIFKNQGDVFSFWLKRMQWAALASKTKGFKAGDRLFSWGEYWFNIKKSWFNIKSCGRIWRNGGNVVIL